MVLLAVGLLTATLIIYATTPTWGLMVAAGIFLGLGIGLIDAGVNTYMVQDADRANGIGALHGFYGVGALTGPAIATTLLALGFSWRLVYGVLALLISGLVALVLVALVQRYPGLGKTPTDDQAAALQTLGQALQSPIVLLTGLLLGIYVGVEAAITHWAFMVETVARQTPTWVAGYGVSLYWLGLTVGRFGLSYLLPRVGAARLITLSLSLLLVGLLTWGQGLHPWLSLPLVGVSLAVIFPAAMWLMPKRVAPSQIPAAVGFASSSASLGAAIIPSGVGWVANVWGLGVVPWLMLPLAVAMLVLHVGLGRLLRPTDA
jgi:fucose permease